MKVTQMALTAKVDRLYRHWLALAGRGNEHPSYPDVLTAGTRLAGVPMVGVPMIGDAVADRVIGMDIGNTIPVADLPPGRDLLDPASIPALLPNIMLVEFETAPFRVRVRLTGTLIDDASGTNLTGTYLDDFHDGVNDAAIRPVIADYRQVWQTGRPVFGFYPWITSRGHTIRVCYGLFPLAIDGEIRQAVAIEEKASAMIVDRPWAIGASASASVA